MFLLFKTVQLLFKKQTNKNKTNRESCSGIGIENKAHSTSLSQKHNMPCSTNTDKWIFSFSFVFFVLSDRCACDINPTHYILQFCVNILKIGL